MMETKLKFIQVIPFLLANIILKFKQLLKMEIQV